MDKTEEKILKAAIECVEEFGLNGATNRRIAEKAGVNLAAINYYYRSKENLILKVMQTTLDNAFDWDDFASLPGDTPQEFCVSIFCSLIEGGLSYPGISRAHFYDLLTAGDYESLIVKRYSGFIRKLVDELENRGSHLNKKDLEMACAQISYACFMAILSPKLNEQGVGINLFDLEMRKKFVLSLIDKLL